MRRGLLALLLCAATPAAATAIEVAGPAVPGGLLIVHPPAETLMLLANGRALPPAPDGRWVVGLGRDAAGPLRLEAWHARRGRLALVELAIAPRAYPEDRLPARAARRGPANPQIEARAARERAAIIAAKAIAAERPEESDGWRRPWQRPLSGRISGGFGDIRYLGGAPRPPHLGEDVAAPRGTPVLAPAAGIVRLADGPYLAAGNLIILDHGAGIISRHLHLDRIDVVPGQRVRAGERIGAVGSTGNSTGPHLHWDVARVWRAGDGIAEVRIDPALLTR